MMKADRARELEHQMIVSCKERQEKKIIQSIDVVFKRRRAEKGVKMQ